MSKPKADTQAAPKAQDTQAAPKAASSDALTVDNLLAKAGVGPATKLADKVRSLFADIQDQLGRAVSDPNCAYFGMCKDSGADGAVACKVSRFNLVDNVSVSTNKTNDTQVTLLLSHIALSLHHNTDYPAQSAGGPLRQSKADRDKGIKIYPAPWSVARSVAMAGGTDKGNARKFDRAMTLNSPNVDPVGKWLRCRIAMRLACWLLQNPTRCLRTDAGAAYVQSIRVDPDKVDVD